VVEAARIAVPTRLLYRPESAGADGQIDPAAATYRSALNCAAKDEDNSEPLAQVASADENDQHGLPADDWNVERTEDGAYVATHAEHPGFRLKLEMYGSGEPDLLHWQELTDPLRGIGLLHYYAGASPQGDRLEYIAVIDTDRSRLLAIEPASWGEKQATWTWNETTLAVVDPQGVPSLVQLNGQLSNALRLDGKHIMLKRGRRPSQYQGQIARRSRQLPYAQFTPPRRMRGYAPADLSAYYAQRVPPRFRQRSMGYPGTYAYSPYR
jgi:hypothetical protein